MAASSTVMNTLVLWKTWNFLTRSVTVVSEVSFKHYSVRPWRVVVEQTVYTIFLFIRSKC